MSIRGTGVLFRGRRPPPYLLLARDRATPARSPPRDHRSQYSALRTGIFPSTPCQESCSRTPKSVAFSKHMRAIGRTCWNGRRSAGEMRFWNPMVSAGVRASLDFPIPGPSRAPERQGFAGSARSPRAAGMSPTSPVLRWPDGVAPRSGDVATMTKLAPRRAGRLVAPHSGDVAIRGSEGHARVSPGRPAQRGCRLHDVREPC